MLRCNTVGTRPGTRWKRSNCFKNCVFRYLQSRHIWRGWDAGIAGTHMLLRVLVLQFTQVGCDKFCRGILRAQSRTAAEIFPSSNLEVIAATLVASGPPLRLLERNPGMSSACEPLFLKRLMRTDGKFLLLPPLSRRCRKFDPKPDSSRQAV